MPPTFRLSTRHDLLTSDVVPRMAEALETDSGSKHRADHDGRTPETIWTRAFIQTWPARSASR